VTGVDGNERSKTNNEEIFDEHASHYSSTIDQSLAAYGANHDFFTRHKTRLIERLLAHRRRDPRKMDLVDVGCGIGKIHELIGPMFGSVTGIDVSTESIAKARTDFPDYTYFDYDDSRLPVADASADLALAICVFHHVPPEEWQQLASEMLRILRPGGLALVIEHNPWNPVTRRIVNNCPIDRDAVLLTRKTTAKLFHSAGASRVVSRSVISVPPLNNTLMSFDAVFGVLPFGAQYYCMADKPDAGDEG